jgi:hypothetical protein
MCPPGATCLSTFCWFSEPVHPGVVLSRSLFVRCLLAIVLSVLLRFPDSNYQFGILKLFFNLTDQPKK